jgi:hypothetical protein
LRRFSLQLIANNKPASDILDRRLGLGGGRTAHVLPYWMVHRELRWAATVAG